MRGYVRSQTARDEDVGLGTLEPWEALVVDAVGNVIDFWKFKRNQGRVWALLFLRGAPLTAAEIQTHLGLSKGAVSMLVRELESWSVVRRCRAPREDAWHYEAETDLMKMIGRVLTEREQRLVHAVRDDLERAVADARRAGDVPKDVLERLVRLRDLAILVDRALEVFLRTARLDIGRVVSILAGARLPVGPGRAR